MADTSDRPGPRARRAAERARRRGRITSGFATVRDLMSFLAGMAVIGHEVFVSASVDPYAIGIGVALTGLPIVFGGTATGGGR